MLYMILNFRFAYTNARPFQKYTMDPEQWKYTKYLLYLVSIKSVFTLHIY